MRHAVEEVEGPGRVDRSRGEGRKGAGAAAARREDHGQLEDEAIKRHALEEIARLLDSTLPGSSEPDYLDRGLGVYLVARLFSVGTRSELIDLLREIRPNVLDDPCTNRLLDLDAARRRLLEAVSEGRVDASEVPNEPLVGLRRSAVV